MTSFTIDDVRETMPGEVTRFLSDIESAGNGLLGHSLLSESMGWQAAASLLRMIAARGHAISGTSSLVSANALATCAHLIEEIAARSDTELREARERHLRARRALELIPLGVSQMREVLQLELEHKQDEALWLATEWQGKAEALIAEFAKAQGLVSPKPIGLTSMPPRLETEPDDASSPKSESASVADESTFEFEEDPTKVYAADSATSDDPNVVDPSVQSEGSNAPKEPTESAEDGEFYFDELTDDEPAGAQDQSDMMGELQSVFQQETRELVVVLQGHLTALAADPTDRRSALAVERMYHTLKGAAATVGFPEVSARASDLQLRSEAAAVEGIDGPTLEGLVRDTNEMLALAGLDTIGVTAQFESVPVSPGLLRGKLSSKERAIRDAFVTEARELHDEASGLLAELSRASEAKEILRVLEKLRAIFHRLKGSALVASEEDISATATSLENACCDSQAPTTAQLSLGLARIASKLGLSDVRSTSEPSEDSRTAAATRTAFEAEAGQLIEEALLRLQSPMSNADASEQSVPYDTGLALLLHRLQGSARIVGDESIAEEARTLESLVREATSSVSSPTLYNRLLELRSRFGTASSLVQSEVGEGQPPRREKIELTAPSELWETFLLECTELLENMERSAIALEDSSSPKEHLRTLMRLVHTLKGVVNTTGLAPTGRMLHRVEDFLESLLEAPILPPMRAIASLLLGVQAQVRKNLKDAPSGFIETAPEQLERKIAATLSAQQHRTAALRGTMGGSERNELSSVRSELSSVRSEAVSEASDARGPDRRVIRVATERLDSLMNLAGELVVNRSRLNSRVDRLQGLQTELVRGSRRLLETVDEFREEHEFVNLDGRRITALTGTDDSGAAASPLWADFGELELDRYESIHVLTRRLTELTSDFTELHAQLSRGLAALTDDSDVVGSIVTGIQTEVTRARMVPLELLFLRLRLPLRDAATRERKEVRDVVRGEDVPIDKTIADALFQPMLHLVRNAVGHGIESTSARVKAAKDPIGTVELSARQESGQILIEVRDDGAGLDLASLRARGVEMGILPSDTPVDDPRIKEMVFVPGLSTRKVAGDVAGRGVGGDVVKRTIERLNGTIRIDSTPGRGTVFSIRLPITLAITRALIVRQGQHLYAIPLHFAERIIDVNEPDIVTTGNIRRVKANGLLLPVRNLGEFLGNEAEHGTEGPILMLCVGDSRLALQIDAIVSHEDVVVKSLGSILSGHPVFAGINIRGTGELVLIVDVPSLVEGRGTASRTNVGGSSTQDADAVPEPVRVREAERAQAARPARVMFVDDSLSVRKVAEMQLKELGAEVTVALDGLDALTKLREHKVDIVFTDLEMPRMHGYELIRELRFLPAFKDLPIVVVSSRSGQKYLDQARQLGANEYLTKPFTVQMLSDALKKWRFGIRAAEETHS